MHGQPLAQREPGCGGDARRARRSAATAAPGSRGRASAARRRPSRRRPAPSSRANSAGRTGSAAPGCASAGRAPAGRPRRRGQVLVQLGVGGRAHRGVRLGPEVLDDHLLDRAVLRGRPCGSRTATRPARPSVSPMPTRMPVVNGIVQRPASSSTRSRTAGSLSGRAEVRAAGRRSNSRREVVSSIIPIDGATGLSRCSSSHDITPGVEVRQQPGLLQHPDRHRPDVGQRGVVAVRVEPLAGRRPAVLGTVAEREQRLLAAERGALRRDVEHLVRREVRRPAPGRAWWRTCSSGSGRGTAGSAG